MSQSISSQIKGLLFGIAIGDALGVPVEFRSRSSLQKAPVTDMHGYGTHHQPPGTWSDDSALTFCLVEQLIEGFSIEGLAQKIQLWYFENYWTPHGSVFDIGIATRNAIDRLEKGVSPEASGESGEYSNGNGSLMRLLPLAFSLKNSPISERFDRVSEVSSITHGHIRSRIVCFFAVEFLIQLLKGKDKVEAYQNTQHTVRDFVNSIDCAGDEKELFVRIFYDDIRQLPEQEIFSSGYVVHTLEASLWCFLTTDSFEAAVLKAVNLGDDTDTTGAVTGGMAGLYYGFSAIRPKWVKLVARSGEIEHLSERFAALYQ
ncbi:MAG: ADP-ribosylglycohydrolase family protein [Spirosomataceae bacterium]